MTARRIMRMLFRILYEGLLVATIVFMVVPSIVVVVLSFSNDAFIRFPPNEWGLRQYDTLLTSGVWGEPFVRSLTLALAVAAVAVPAGLLAVFALNRTAIPGKGTIQFLALAPLLVPGVAYAVAMYLLFTRIGLVGTFGGLVIAHATLALPFVVLISGAAITRVPRELEMAAWSLGASRARAWFDVTLRLLIPAIVASFIFAFITSFDEVVMASFLSAAGYTTLPVAIFSSVRYGVDPVITAISTLLTIATALLLFFYAVLRRAE
jgi:putative spermidine/putrescine transport system permease protein